MKLPKILILILPIILVIISGCMMLSGMMIDRSKGTVFTIKLKAYSGDSSGLGEKAAKVIGSRMDAGGIDGEAAVDKDSADQVVVKIYGSNDLEKTKRFLFTTNQLELKEVVSPSMPNPIEVYPTREAAEKRYQDVHEILPYTKDGQEVFVVIKKVAIVTGEGIRDATAASRTDAESDYFITFSLKPQDAQTFGGWTGKNVGKYLAIVLDKKVITAPFIKSQIFDSGQIDGKFTKEEAENIALSLKSGYLPAAMKIVKEEKFGN